MRSFFASLFLLVVSNCLLSQEIKKVLFIGDAFTQYNTMPQTLADIASSLGDSVYWVSATYNGYTLEQHASNSQTMAYIAGDEWDHVILQEQGQLPALSNIVFEESVKPFASELCQAARSANICVKPIFFDTWGFENGDEEYCFEFPWVCDYSGQQDTLTSRYLQLCEDNDAWCAPVGEVWRAVLDITNNEAVLYADDGQNPSKLGSYLVACTFYSVLFGQTPEGAEIPETVDQEDAQLVQAISGNTVLYGDQDWNFDPLVWADMEFTEGDIFWDVVMNTSANVDSVLVDNGIDTTMWLSGESGAFTFSEGGTYYYLLHVFSPCGELTVLDSLVIALGIEDQSTGSLKIFPNPANDIINIETEETNGALVMILDQRGRIIHREKKNSQRIKVDVSSLPSGQYEIIVMAGKVKQIRTLIKR